MHGAKRPFECHSYQLTPGPNAGPEKQLLDDRLHATFGDAKVLPDLSIGKPPKDSKQHPLLSIVQTAPGSLMVGLKRIGQLIRQELDDFLIDPDRPARYQPDRLHETFRSLGFQKDSGCSKLHYCRQFLRLGRPCNDQEAAFETVALRGGYELISVLHTHIQIQEDNIDWRPVQDRKSFMRSTALARYFKTRLSCQQPAQARTK